MIKKALLEKINDKSAVVCVAGLGYVGLPFAVEQAKAGYTVIGMDKSEDAASKINSGVNYIADVDDGELKKVVDAGKLKAVTSFEAAGGFDILVIAVPTPLTKNLTPDLFFIETVTREFAPHIKRGQFISLESTTYPGTTEEVMLPILEKSGLKVEKDFFLAHSPERVDPGNAVYSTKNTTKVVGGVGPESIEVAMAFYSQTISEMVPVSSAKAAELVKVFENTFRAVNIALVNEMTYLCDRMDLNVWEVLDAAFTKPFGIMPFYPGPGVGGHCIPLDPHYLEWKAKEVNFTTRFISLAGETNRRMPEFVLTKMNRILNEQGIALSRAKVLALGASYKKDVNDCRESPAITVMQLIKKSGTDLCYHDPYVPDISPYSNLDMKSVPLTPETIKAQDVIIILTAHSDIDYDALCANAKCVFDTRNATKNVKDKSNIILL
ncbi:MAG: nucleotide sugar dehydrogenase [Abditibacteriota bacterium]|nr:nucleotide sugar dehydrogenase [Abditibacteriota bacterium]